MSQNPLTTKYPSIVVRDTYKDGSPCWYAKHTDLPGCIAYATDKDEAIALLEKARVAYISSLLKRHLPVPESSEQPASASETRLASATMTETDSAWVVKPTPKWTPTLVHA